MISKYIAKNSAQKVTRHTNYKCMQLVTHQFQRTLRDPIFLCDFEHI